MTRPAPRDRPPHPGHRLRRLPPGPPHRPRIQPHYRVRRDRVDPGGVITPRYDSRLRHLGLGREHAREQVLILVADRNVRVINAETGDSSAPPPVTAHQRRPQPASRLAAGHPGPRP